MEYTRFEDGLREGEHTFFAVIDVEVGSIVNTKRDGEYLLGY